MAHEELGVDARESFPVDALPGVVATFVAELSAALGCVAEVVATPLLAVLAGAVGAGAMLKLKAGHVEPCALWGVVITTGDALAVDQVIENLVAPVRAYEDDCRASVAEQHRFREKRMQQIRRQRAQGDYVSVDSEPPLPGEPRQVLVHDIDVARIARTLAANRSGVLLARPDLDSWWSGLLRSSRRGDAVYRTWRQLYHRQTIDNPRPRGGSGSETAGEPVADAVCSVAGAISYGTFRTSATLRRRDDDAEPWPEMLRVALLTMPPASVPAWTDVAVSERTRECFAHLVDGILFDNQLVDESDEPSVLELAAPARVAWADAHAKVAAFGPAAVSLTARLTLVFLRVLSTLSEQDESTFNDEVEADTVARAAQLARWYERERRRIVASLGASSETERLARVVRFLRANGNVASVRDLMRHGPRFTTADAARDALDRLAADGRGAWYETPSAGAAARFHLSETVTPATG